MRDGSCRCLWTEQGCAEGGLRLCLTDNSDDQADVTPTDTVSGAQSGAAARKLFEASLVQLVETVTGVDAVELLARAGLVRLCADLGPSRQAKGPLLEVFHLELLQALSLSAERLPVSVGTDYPGVTQAAIGLIERNGLAYRDQWRGKITTDAAANQRLELIAQVQGWTLAVRGPRHTHQTLEYLAALTHQVDASFRHHFGCSAETTFTMLCNIITLFEGRMKAEFDWRRRWFWDRGSLLAMVEAFVEPLNAQAAELVRIYFAKHKLPRDALRLYLWNEAEHRLASTFTFGAEDILPPVGAAEAAGLRAVLRRLSLGFGEVTSDQLRHLHLNNPVRLQPLVRLTDDRYFCPNPQSLGTGLAEILEALCASAPSLKANWEDARSTWLEQKLKAVVREHLPHADVHSKVRWKDPQGGKEWESDVVAVIDKTVIIFEAKSGKISSAGRRGAVGSLKKDLGRLVVEPSEQSERLKRRLQAAEASVEFSSAEGPFVVDVTDLRFVGRVNILVDSIGALSAHWPQMKAAGLIPEGVDVAPTMSIFELETVFEVLTLELERCHYLNRRAEFERNARYTADELDLLAFYLDTQFNIGEDEYNGLELKLYGLSLALAERFSNRLQAGTLSFPIRRTERWRALLAALESHRPVGWTRFGHRLLCIDHEGQAQIDRLVREGWRGVGRSPGAFFTSGITYGPAGHHHTIQFAIGPAGSADEFQGAIDYATRSGLSQSNLDDLLLIFWFSARTGQAYDFIGVMKRLSDQPATSTVSVPWA
jgi:hypothetical protein